MLDLLNPTPTQRKIENELLFGTRDICCIGTARAGKGVAVVKGMVLRSQMHKEMGIGCGNYLLIAQSVGTIHRNSKAYFADVCRQLGYSFRTRGNPDPHFDVNGAKFFTFGGANADAALVRHRVGCRDRTVLWPRRGVRNGIGVLRPHRVGGGHRVRQCPRRGARPVLGAADPRRDQETVEARSLSKSQRRNKERRNHA